MADTAGVVLPSRNKDKVPPTEDGKLVDRHVKEMMELVPEGLQSSLLNKLVNQHSKSNKLHLLGLPAELNNRVSRLVLIEEDHVEISATCPPPPGLLRVSKQVRDDTIHMNHSENVFRVIVNDYDAQAVVSCYQTHLRYDSPKSAADLSHGIKRVSITGNPNWANLSDWRRAVHLDEFYAVRVGGSNVERATITAMFDITERMNKNG